MERSFNKQVSVSELLTMRRSGMTNKMIADHLDVSYKTVYNSIGKDIDYGFGIYLDNFMKSYNITINELSKIIGKPSHYIKDIIDDKVHPNAIARYYIGLALNDYENNHKIADTDSYNTDKFISKNTIPESSTVDDIFDYIISKEVIYEVGLGFFLQIKSNEDSVIYVLKYNDEEIFTTNDKDYLSDKINQVLTTFNKILNMD